MRNIDLDACLKLVSNAERRAVIRRLRRRADDETSIDDLVEQLCATGSSPPIGRDVDRDRLTLQLVHTHLPKLDSHGIVDYDPSRAVVRYRSDDRVEAVLDSLATELPPARIDVESVSD